jgi:hypothetical protein
VDITANPTGPQLHAPAAAPTIVPKTPPLIFCLELFKIWILKIFIGITKADSIQIIKIKENPNSVPEGM